MGKWGALLCIQQCSVIPVLYWIRSVTSSQGHYCVTECRLTFYGHSVDYVKWQNFVTILSLATLQQGAPWSWKVMEFRKTFFQAWKVMENSKGHGKSWKMIIMSWNFYYCTEQFCKSDKTLFTKSNYEPFYLFNNGTTSRWNCHY